MVAWSDKDCFWGVICKNRHFHDRRNIWFGHPILLAEADFYSSLPIHEQRIRVHCDTCGKDYEYNRSEIVRLEADPVASFNRHPLFPQHSAKRSRSHCVRNDMAGFKSLRSSTPRCLPRSAGSCGSSITRLLNDPATASELAEFTVDHVMLAANCAGQYTPYSPPLSR